MITDASFKFVEIFDSIVQSSIFSPFIWIKGWNPKQIGTGFSSFYSNSKITYNFSALSLYVIVKLGIP